MGRPAYSSTYAVVETDENGVAQEVTLKEGQEAAIDYAVSIAQENEYAESEPALREQLADRGYITDGGWTITVINTRRDD